MAVEVLQNLKRAVLEYDTQGAATWAARALEEKVHPVEAMDALTEAIRQVGDAFAKQELFLPELVGASDAMQGAVPIIEKEMEKLTVQRKCLGIVVIGTVYGDIHNIGKTMVASLLRAENFDVYDLGVNINADQFVGAIEKHRAQILAMSALLSTTAPEQSKVVETLERLGLRHNVRIMVGGGAITEEFSRDIGADGYDPTAVGAVKLAKRLLEEQ